MTPHLPVGRRTAIGAAAWTAPVVAIATAAPAYAASAPAKTTVTETTANYVTGAGTVTFLLDPAPSTTPTALATYSRPATPSAPVLTDLGASGTGRLYRCTFTLTTRPTVTTAVTVTISPTGYPGTSTVATFDRAGSLDSSITGGGGGNGPVYAIAPAAGGKIIIGGNFVTYNGVTTRALARLNASGSLDTTFTGKGTGPSNDVLAVAVQADGKILIGGFFATFNGVAARAFARLDTNGALDATFTGKGAGPDNTVRAIAVQADGAILIGGSFGNYDGTAVNRFARLKADGSLDTTFVGPGAGPNGIVRAIAVQTDGMILISGDFDTYDGVVAKGLARLKADGSLDTTFVGPASVPAPSPGVDSGVFGMAVQADGKILIAGPFTTYDGVAANRFARLTADGTRDSSFTGPGSGPNSTVHAVAIQPDAKILIGGSFTTYNGTEAWRIARLLA